MNDKQRMDRKLGEAIVAASPAMFAYIQQLAVRGDAEAILIVERVEAWALRDGYRKGMGMARAAGAPSIDKS